MPSQQGWLYWGRGGGGGGGGGGVGGGKEIEEYEREYVCT